MDVLFLGTGAADGWPNPFCRCDSCVAAAASGEIRTPTSVLVDGSLLIDCGPEAPRQAVRAGTNLASVRTVLITHVHSDHLDPAFLLHRSWVSSEPLDVYGPRPVIEECRHWLNPSQRNVQLHEIRAGERFSTGTYAVDVLAANHEALGEAVLYRVDDGRRSFLYACDTGVFPEETLETLGGRRLDLAIIEETFGDRSDLNTGGHLDLETFAQTVATLRTRGVIDDATRIVAAHVSHHNPVDLRDRLADLGAELLSDGAQVLLSSQRT